MQLNYFGAIRLVMGLLPKMREQQRGHVVNISSIGVQTNPPRFSAYVASKAALDSWSNVVASELVGDGDHLHQHPHAAGADADDRADQDLRQVPHDLARRRPPTWSIKAMVERPHEINTLLGNAGAVAHTLAPEDGVPGAQHGLPGVPRLGRRQGRRSRRHPRVRADHARPALQGRALVAPAATWFTRSAPTRRVNRRRRASTPLGDRGSSAQREVATGRRGSVIHSLQLPG